MGTNAAQPRSRRENQRSTPPGLAWPGSSPLTRGKRGVDCELRRLAGLIPAHAGKTAKNGIQRRRAGAHPRSRGENSVMIWTSCRGSGSSPLTRGKLVGDRLASAVYRLIPAHAGKTCGAFELVGLTPAHPRSRGENHQLLNVRLRNVGSSPLTRGKPHRRADQHRSERLIPAHAGKTQPCPCRTSRRTAHPRSRGEN